MARERLVTRTVTTTNYTVMIVDLATKTVEETVIAIPSADNLNEKQLSKAISDNIPAGKVFVQITAQTKNDVLYGMSEADFIKLAKILPPRTSTTE